MNPLPTLLSVVLAITSLTPVALAAPQGDVHIRVDQFGYRPLAQKVAVIRVAQQGYDAPDAFTPSGTYEVHRTTTGSVAYAAAIKPWNQGQTHAQSGDKAWWFDFSALQEVGEFVVHDPSTGAESEPFWIAQDVYREVLIQAVRMYTYQRCGVEKSAAVVGTDWADTPCHVAQQQDTDCRFVQNPSSSTSRDLSGGWHDAGDYNKYMNYADGAVHDLLRAYEDQPFVFTDDFGIPESGNGVPDLLDEVRWELEWMLKMQESDGSVHHKMGATDWSSGSPVSNDLAARRYAEPTASATISACGSYAHAARIYSLIPSQSSFAATLETAARKSWGWLESNPSAIPSHYNNSGFLTTTNEDDDWWQEANMTAASAHLFALTGESKFRDYFDANYENIHLLQWNWASPWENEINDALLVYAESPGATENHADRIRAAFANSVSGSSWLGQARNEADAYRAHLNDQDYSWGSNRTKSQVGLMLMALNRNGLSTADAKDCVDAAEGYLHYIHGVNPTGYCYLTNMSDFGADQSLDEMYHQWFGHNTPWDNASTSQYGPPPGYLVGGPNKNYRPDNSYSGPPIEPPMNQPVQKSYRDWNTGWPENAWEVTESHIPYQAAYVHLLAHFAANAPDLLALNVPLLQSGQSHILKVGGATPQAQVAVVWSLTAGRTNLSGKGWHVDFGLNLPADPRTRVVGLGQADSNGVAQFSFDVPNAMAGAPVYFQAAERSSQPSPIQSAVIYRVVR